MHAHTRCYPQADCQGRAYGLQEDRDKDGKVTIQQNMEDSEKR